MSEVESQSDPAANGERPLAPSDVLPPVEPPGVAFLVQLFLIPLFIVSMIVAVWLLFSWLAHAGSDPRAIVQEIQEGRGIRWQRAMTLASMLDHENSQYATLRSDPEFAQQLGKLLESTLSNPPTEGKGGDEDLELRYYLCRVVGQLETTEAVPALVLAARTERVPREVVVRLGALESLTVAAHRLGSERLREVPNLLPVLLECSHASDELDPPPQGDDLPGYRPHGEVRGVAAFALGVLGGEEAQARLVAMLDDGYPAARYNAATGLARLGDPRGTEVLLEMLDPENQQAASDERRQADQEIRRRTVLLNGLEAVRQLAAHPGGTPSPPLQAAVAKLATDPLESIAAREVRSLIQRRATEVMRELQDNKN